MSSSSTTAPADAASLVQGIGRRLPIAVSWQSTYPFRGWWRFARVAAVPARLVLAGIVAASFAVRFVMALGHSTPLYFPDEYIYSAISRSLAEHGRPLIRGAAPRTSRP